MKTVDLILTSDWHLRETVPVCRTDNFWNTQWNKVQFIKELQEKYNCPVIHAGDLFHHWKPSPFLLSKTIEFLPRMFYTIYGNHDLPQHNLELAEKCGINVLLKAKKLKVLPNASWGQEPDESAQYSFFENRSILVSILVWHTMTWKDKEPFPGCKDAPAKQLLKKYPQYDIIVTGDNHETFVEEYKGRILVNPGSLTRQTAAQVDHKPCVFLWFAKTNTVEQVFLPIDKNVISREHINEVDKRNNRIEAFISGLQTDLDFDVSFSTNLRKFLHKNKTNSEVVKIIDKFIEK